MCNYGQLACNAFDSKLAISTRYQVEILTQGRYTPSASYKL